MGAVSLRDDIINYIMAQLALITKANGYNFDVKFVGEDLKDPDALADDQFPALFVLDSDEIKDFGSVTELKNELSPVIIGYVKMADDQLSMKPEVRKLLADIEKAICANPRFGGLIDSVRPSSIKTDHGVNVPYGIIEFIFKIAYLQDYGDP